MARSKNQWVLPRKDGKWEHKGEGNKKATKVTDTQKEAKESAERVAKNVGGEAIVQGRDHRIVSKDSYGEDSCPPRDKEH